MRIPIRLNILFYEEMFTHSEKYQCLKRQTFSLLKNRMVKKADILSEDHSTCFFDAVLQHPEIYHM